MEEKFNVLIPKTYKYLVFDFCYKKEHVDYKKAVVDRKATEEIQKFIKNCDCDIIELSKEQIENLFEKGFILIRLSKTELKRKVLINIKKLLKEGLILCS